jgi:acetyl-CoA carboxylase biotin carboxyl carrier protein
VTRADAVAAGVARAAAGRRNAGGVVGWRGGTRKGGVVAEQVRADMVANVFEIGVRPGESVEAGQTLLVLESMKMEIPVVAEDRGVVREITVKPGEVVQEGDVLVVLD